MDPVNAELGQLLAHSGEVDDLADRVENALSAAEHLTGLDDAYGVFGRPFVGALMREAHEPGITAIRDAARALRGVGARLRSNAADFEATDNAIEHELGSAGDRLPTCEVPEIGTGQP